MTASTDLTCIAPKCRKRPPHDVREHLDPKRRDLYESPEELIQRLGGVGADPLSRGARHDPLLALRAMRHDNPHLIEVIDIAVETTAARIADLLEQIDKLKQQKAAIRVDADNKVRQALRKGDTCRFHGEVIHEQTEQISNISWDRDRVEDARKALLGLLFVTQDFTTAARANHVLPNLDKIVTFLEKSTAKASAAHSRAFDRPRPQRPALAAPALASKVRQAPAGQLDLLALAAGEL